MTPSAIFERLVYLAYVARREALRAWCRVMNNKRKPILTVFDPALEAYNGHHMEFARIIKEELKSGYSVRFYANFYAATKVALSLPASPICYESIYRSADVSTAATIAALNKMDASDIGPDAILVMHTVTAYQLGSVADWFSNLPISLRPKLCMQFQFPLEFRLPNDGISYDRAIGSARTAAGILAGTGRVRFAANSNSLAERISRQLRQRCAILPVPTRWPNLNSMVSPDPGHIFGFLGGLRPEKGASIMAEAIPAFAARYPDSRFLVHAPREESIPSVVDILERIPQVDLIRKNFSTKKDYFRQFMRASCILLPYDPREYAYRTSGILIESLGLNKLIITTKNSWLLTEAERRGGNVVPMESFTSESLFSALAAAQNLLKSSPLTPTINYQVIKENSPKAFCSALIQLASDASDGG
jgi:glycosyltransferase involved in cell wall biosynthesis